MAVKLREQGEQVALLTLLDTTVPRSSTLRAGERARIHWQRFCRRGLKYLVEWGRNRWRWETAKLRRSQRAQGTGALESEFRSEEIGAAFRRALATHRVPAYGGTITLFRPKLDIVHRLGGDRMTNAKREFLFHDNGWGAHAAEVVVREVPGDHDSMVLEPNVRVLAARLGQCIRQAEAAAPVPQASNGRSLSRS
jgi:thioesterase domain-containing protein